MRPWCDGNRLVCHVNPQLGTFGIDIGEVLAQKRFGQMGHVQMHAVDAVFFHLKVNRTGNDVTRCEFATLIVVKHKTITLFAVFTRQTQNTAFAAQGF